MWTEVGSSSVYTVGTYKFGSEPGDAGSGVFTGLVHTGGVRSSEEGVPKSSNGGGARV